jgi:hypothetical protein
MSLSLSALYGAEVKMTAVFVAGDEKKCNAHAYDGVFPRYLKTATCGQSRYVCNFSNESHLESGAWADLRGAAKIRHSDER